MVECNLITIKSIPITSVYVKYYNLLSNLKDKYTEEQISVYSYILTVRQSRGQRIPTSLTPIYNDKLHYKLSLQRPSPYYVDLHKIENLNDKLFLIDKIIHTIKPNTYYKYKRSYDLISSINKGDN